MHSENPKKEKNMTQTKRMTRITAILTVALLVLALGVLAAVGYGAPAQTAYATSTVSFTKVTDASQLTAENIGECTFDEAKAWVYDNWDAVTNGVDPTRFIDIVYIVNGSARYIAFFTGDCTDKDTFNAMIQSNYDANLDDIKINNFGYDVVYVCSKAAALRNSPRDNFVNFNRKPLRNRNGFFML